MTKIEAVNLSFDTLTEEQLNWFLKLNSMGFKSYITNNPIFFKKVILEEIKKYFS